MTPLNSLSQTSSTKPTCDNQNTNTRALRHHSQCRWLGLHPPIHEEKRDQSQSEMPNPYQKIDSLIQHKSFIDRSTEDPNLSQPHPIPQTRSISQNHSPKAKAHKSARSLDTASKITGSSKVRPHAAHQLSEPRQTSRTEPRIHIDFTHLHVENTSHPNCLDIQAVYDARNPTRVPHSSDPAPS